MIVVLDSVLALGYHGVVTGNDIRGKGPLEFELRVENGLGFMDRTGSVLEISGMNQMIQYGNVTITIILSLFQTHLVLPQLQ